MRRYLFISIVLVPCSLKAITISTPTTTFPVRVPYLDVLNYGLIGDDATTNDTAMSKLISLATTTSPSGSIIYFKEGTYRFQNEIYLPGVNNISIYGAGRNTTFLKTMTANQNCVHYFGTNGGIAVMKDIQILTGITPKTSGAGIYLENGGLEEILRVSITAQFIGINLSNASSIRISHTDVGLIVPTSGVGLQINGGLEQRISHCTFESSNSTPLAQTGIYVLSSGALYMDHIIAFSDVGIDFAPSANNEVNDIFMSDIVTDGCTTVGMRLRPTGPNGKVRYLHDVNSWYTSNKGYGITIEAASSGTIVDDISIMNPRVYNNTLVGINITTGTDISIIGGTFTGNSAPPSSSGSYSGILVAATDPGPVRLVSNRSGQLSEGFSNLQKYGIEISPSSVLDNYIIVNNDLRNNLSGNLSDGGLGLNKQVSGNLPLTANESILPGSQTLSQLKILTPGSAGQIYYCSNCITDAVCVSTGTGIGAFARGSSRTTVCQ